MRILVDAGNTSTKWQLRSGGEAVADGQGDLALFVTGSQRWMTLSNMQSLCRV